MHVQIRLLGGFGVAVDGQPVPEERWRRRSAADLVKLLALQPDRRMGREQVIDALWPDLLLDEAAPRLHSAAHYARTALGSPEAVVLARGAVALLPTADVSVDVDELRRAAEAARSDGRSAAEAALARSTGTLLPDDLYEPWTEEPRERLRVLHQDLLRAAGRYEELVAADPLDEEAHLGLVATLLGAGRRRDALRALDAMAEVFDRELGVAPGPAAQDLRRQAESLPVETPVTLGRGRAPLPSARSRLVGRADDLAAVTGLLRRHRVVTITGPGGAGKSTLALAVARHLPSADDAEGGADVILAELAPARDAEDVVRTVAEAAGVQGEGSVRSTSLAANLGPQTVLLLLDNCEHLLDASAELVDAVLDAGAQARVLVTSREPLQVDGEAVHRIGSLGADAAAELFAERAVAAAGPGAVVADDHRVVDLCKRLDGLPLAIELAAAQLRHLSLDDLVERLDDRLSLLVGGRPKAGPRHSALTATIDWSYRLLSARSREMFDLLGVFPASFDLAAAEAVAGGLPPAQVANVLGDLVAKSLVAHDPTTHRYVLLETIRLFAARRLDATGRREEMTELLRRHVLARATATTRVRTWLSASTAARSRDDLDNVRAAFEASLACGDLSAAVDVALSLSTLWRNAVSYAEGRHWVNELLSRDLAPRDRLWTLVLAADVGLGSGDPRLMRETVARASVLVEELDEPGAAVICAIYDAMVHLRTPARAAERLAGARDQARAAGEPGLERLARGFRLVPMRMLGRVEGLDDEVEALLRPDTGREYDRYLCLWASSLLALVDRAGPRLRRLMDAQLADLTANGIRGNWLTMYWEALALVLTGEEYLPQLRRARMRAEDEGRRADADCALVLAYAAACEDDWEQAAELLGAVGDALLHDTAGFIHLALVREQLVRPRLDPDVFAAATARGAARDLDAVLDEHGL